MSLNDKSAWFFIFVGAAGFACAQQGPLPGAAGVSGATPQISLGRPSVDTGAGGIAEFLKWVIAGSTPQNYRLGQDRNVFNNHWSFAIESRGDAKSDSVGALVQSIPADEYRGHRVRFSALLNAHKVAGGAGLWVRVDDEDGKALVVDDMPGRRIFGTQAWTHYDVVVDVPLGGRRIGYGVVLVGKGKVGIDAARIDTVGHEVAITADEGLPRAPVNLELAR